MENLLEFDLNELVSKQVMERISSLETQLKNISKLNCEKDKIISELNTKVKTSELSEKLLNKIREEFNKITSSKDENGYDISKQKNQFLFIEKILFDLFGVKKERSGWISSRNDGRLDVYLALNFYSNKEIVIQLLEILGFNDTNYFRQDPIYVIKSFKMPYDYSKNEVLEYVKKPEYNTNGCIFNVSEYWINSGAGKVNMPHNLIMENPYILEDDIFSELLNSIKRKIPNYHYLFALPKYNKHISQKQIELLGECLINLDDKTISYDCVVEFIKENLKKFNEKTLDYFLIKIQSSNQYSKFHWGHFPTQYQMKFLNSKSIDEILKILTNYDCKWTLEEKDNFLKSYYKK